MSITFFTVSAEEGFLFAFRVPLPLNKTAGVSARKLRTPDTRGLAAHSLQKKSPLLPELRKNSSLSRIPPRNLTIRN